MKRLSAQQAQLVEFLSHNPRAFIRRSGTDPFSNCLSVHGQVGWFLKTRYSDRAFPRLRSNTVESLAKLGVLRELGHYPWERYYLTPAKVDRRGDEWWAL